MRLDCQRAPRARRKLNARRAAAKGERTLAPANLKPGEAGPWLNPTPSRLARGGTGQTCNELMGATGGNLGMTAAHPLPFCWVPITVQTYWPRIAAPTRREAVTKSSAASTCWRTGAASVTQLCGRNFFPSSRPACFAASENSAPAFDAAS